MSGWAAQISCDLIHCNEGLQSSGNPFDEAKLKSCKIREKTE